MVVSFHCCKGLTLSRALLPHDSWDTLASANLEVEKPHIFQVKERIFNFQVDYPDLRFKLPFGWFRFWHGSHPPSFRYVGETPCMSRSSGGSCNPT
jgi:hypothetical protein